MPSSTQSLAWLAGLGCSSPATRRLMYCTVLYKYGLFALRACRLHFLRVILLSLGRTTDLHERLYYHIHGIMLSTLDLTSHYPLVLICECLIVDSMSTSRASSVTFESQGNTHLRLPCLQEYVQVLLYADREYSTCRWMDGWMDGRDGGL